MPVTMNVARRKHDAQILGNTIASETDTLAKSKSRYKAGVWPL